MLLLKVHPTGCSELSACYFNNSNRIFICPHTVSGAHQWCSLEVADRYDRKIQERHDPLGSTTGLHSFLFVSVNRNPYD